MKEIKYIVLDRHYDRNDDVIEEINRSLTDFEEVSEEDYGLLVSTKWDLESRLRESGEITYDQSIVMVTKGFPTAQKALLVVADIIDAQKKRKEKEEKRAKTAEEKRIANASKSKKDKELALLAKLKAQYEPDKA